MNLNGLQSELDKILLGCTENITIKQYFSIIRILLGFNYNGYNARKQLKEKLKRFKLSDNDLEKIIDLVIPFEIESPYYTDVETEVIEILELLPISRKELELAHGWFKNQD